MKNIFRKPVVGLALGGGGARGLAHIGVLRVLEEEGIFVDCLAGTSMGGIIAAAYAAGLSVTELETEALRLANLSHLARLVTWTPPWQRLLGGDRARRYFTKLLGEGLTFDTLRLPLALTAVDLVRGQEVMLRQGSVIDAILATAAIPGAFAPVEMDGHRLVDGGVLNNVPADVARQLGAKVVIAVDVAFDVRYSDTEEVPPSPPGPILLPAILRDVWHAELIMIRALTEIRLRQARPEVIIHPPLPSDITFFTGFTRAEELITAGEEAAREALPQIHQAIQPGLHLVRSTWQRLLSRRKG
jgi:NTE family protein